MLCHSEKRIQPLAHELAALSKKMAISFYSKQRRIGRDALCFERSFTTPLDNSCEILARRLVADLPICLAANEGEVRNIVGFPRPVGASEDRFRENVMELQSVLRSLVPQSDRDSIASPVRPRRETPETWS